MVVMATEDRFAKPLVTRKAKSGSKESIWEAIGSDARNLGDSRHNTAMKLHPSCGVGYMTSERPNSLLNQNEPISLLRRAAEN